MGIIPDNPCPIQPLQPGWFEPSVHQVDMLRLDLLHPIVSGNKWYKLKYNLAHAQQDGYHRILTFGGAHSNHLIATAAAAKAHGLEATGIVRGLHAQAHSTPTLDACKANGMQLVFVSREEYALKTDPAWLQQLSSAYGGAFIIPEGGANEWGRKGIIDIAKQIPAGYTHVCLSVGSGTTLAGLRKALPADIRIIGYIPMKGGRYLEGELGDVIGPSQLHNWQLYDEWHFGGFGKWNDELIRFMNDFYTTQHIPLDIVYTGKMMYGLQKQLQNGIYQDDASILCIHTGGLQGNAMLGSKLFANEQAQH